MRRPDVFTLDYSHPLAQGLSFAWLGSQRGASRFLAESIDRGDCALFNTPMSAWSVDAELQRGTLRFDGVNDYATLPDIDSTGDLTVSFFLYQLAATTLSHPIQICSSLNDAFRFGWTTTDIYASCNSGPPSSSATSLMLRSQESNVWKHFSIIKSAARIEKGYFNGVDAFTTANNGWTAASATGSFLGRRANGNYSRVTMCDVFVHNRALSPAEIAVLADRTDPMLGGLIVEDRPVLYFDMGGSPAVEGPAVITAESTVALLGQKGAVCPATVAASASLGMGGVKGASAPLNIVGTASVEAGGQKSTYGTATISAESALGMGGIKAISGLDKEGPAIIAASSGVGMGGVKGAVSPTWIGADSELVAAGVKGGVGSAVLLATGTFQAGKAPDVLPITAAEVARIVRASSRMKTVTASARVKQVRYEVTRA